MLTPSLSGNSVPLSWEENWLGNFPLLLSPLLAECLWVSHLTFESIFKKVSQYQPNRSAGKINWAQWVGTTLTSWEQVKILYISQYLCLGNELEQTHTQEGRQSGLCFGEWQSICIFLSSFSHSDASCPNPYPDLWKRRILRKMFFFSQAVLPPKMSSLSGLQLSLFCPTHCVFCQSVRGRVWGRGKMPLRSKSPQNWGKRSHTDTHTHTGEQERDQF